MPTLVSAADARARLEAGNARYVSGALEHPNTSTARRASLASSQDPFAVVVTCADSRVTPELIFDQGIGDLFVIRVAGNITDDAVLGSIEYAVEHLAVNLVVIMGHQSCGAVGAAVAGDPHHNAIDSLIAAIAPAVEQARGLDGDLLDNAVRCNAKHVAGQVAGAAPILTKNVAERGCEVVPAYYRLADGAVEFLQAG